MATIKSYSDMKALANLLATKGIYFAIGYFPNELDMDSIPKA